MWHAFSQGSSILRCLGFIAESLWDNAWRNASGCSLINWMSLIVLCKIGGAVYCFHQKRNLIFLT